MPYEEYFRQLQTAIPLWMDIHDIPGFSLCVTDREDTLFTGAFGHTDTTLALPVTSETVFSVQSISKTYTAFGFMLAVQDGRVSLEDPVRRYVPTFAPKSRDGHDHAAYITFRQLLTHRAGLSQEAPIGNSFGYAPFEEHVHSINDTYLRFPPGSDAYYSNLGYDLVAYALRQIYDMPFEVFMRERVFAPLGMQRSTYEQEPFLLDVASAIGHDKVPLVKRPIATLGASGLHTCPEDMARFLRCFMRGGAHAGGCILDAALVRRMYGECPASAEWPYQLGLTAGLLGDNALLNHNGGGFGFLTSQDILPDAGLAGAAVTNAVHHPNVQEMILRNIWRDLLALRARGLNDCAPLSPELARYIGLYEVRYPGGQDRIALLPRKGYLYCNQHRLHAHTDRVFFSDNQDCIEMLDDGMVWNSIRLRRV